MAGCIFVGLWVALFVLYFPAARAGFVSDFTGWLYDLQHHSFAEHINRTHFKVVSLYQGTQLATWLYYQWAGIDPWRWHMLFITLQALNATLLYKLVACMLRDSGTDRYRVIALTGSVLFCVSPSLSEVLVWEPCYHYLQGLFMMLLTLHWVQEYVYTRNPRLVWYSIFLFVFATHTLEIFYLTPWLVLLLALFYRYQCTDGRQVGTRIIAKFFIPLLLLFGLRLLEFRLLHGDWVSRIGSSTVLSVSDMGLGKPAKYLYHLIALGRFWPGHFHIGSLTLASVRQSIYQLCDSGLGIFSFWSVAIAVTGWCMFRYKYMTGSARVAFIMWLCMLAALVLVMPLWFYDLLLISMDRYAYFTIPFLAMLAAIGIWRIRRSWLRYALLLVLLLANVRYTIQANRYWMKGERITYSLLHTLPVHNNKITVLLNLPESMHGAPMIGASDMGEYKLMHNLLVPGSQLTGTVYDAMGYNMQSPEDGAHVQVLHDSVLRVRLNQWGTWWWYNALGGHDYENADYSVHVVDGSCYDLTMKKNSSNYLFFYQTGKEWKPVDLAHAGEQY